LDQAVEEDGDVQDGTDVESCFDLLPSVHSGFQYRRLCGFWQGGAGSYDITPASAMDELWRQAERVLAKVRGDAGPDDG